ncbi:MAG: tyrosine-type recombinase/integrase [Thermoleophilia bacterium]|nr:tyrosine-type recombinase/integrase [Thermoleophilia bacterium]
MTRSTSTSTWTVDSAASVGTVTEYVERYLLERQVEGLSPASLKLYRFVLSRFCGFLGEDAPVETLDHDQVRSFFFHIYDHGYKPASLAGFNVVVRIFCKWLAAEGVLEQDPAARIAKPRKPKRVPYCLSEEQVDSLIQACSKNFTGMRTRAILLTFLGTGIRAKELVSLTLDDINLGARTMTVMGKGSKERSVPIGLPLADVLAHWLGKREKFVYGLPIDSLFVTKRRRPPTVHGIYSLITRLGKRAGIRGARCSPHTLRHTFATDFVRGGGDVYTLKEILGHESLNTTQIYIHIADQRVREMFDRADPLRRHLEGRDRNLRLW